MDNSLVSNDTIDFHRLWVCTSILRKNLCVLRFAKAYQELYAGYKEDHNLHFDVLLSNNFQ